MTKDRLPFWRYAAALALVAVGLVLYTSITGYRFPVPSEIKRIDAKLSRFQQFDPEPFVVPARFHGQIVNVLAPSHIDLAAGRNELGDLTIHAKDGRSIDVQLGERGVFVVGSLTYVANNADLLENILREAQAAAKEAAP